MANVSVVGLGSLGQAIARRLLAEGHAVTGYNRTRAKAEELVPQGLVVAETLSDACEADFLLNVLWDDAAVEEVLLPGGRLFSEGHDLFHIAVSTTSVALARRLAEAHAKAGQKFISAPVFGRPEETAEGRHVILAGGEAAAIEAARPVLESLGRIEIMGDDPGAGNAIKMAGNYLMYSAVESLREAIGLVRASNGDAKRFVDIVTAALFPLPFYKGYGGAIAGQESLSAIANPFVHSAQLCAEAALAIGLDLPIVQTVSRA